MKQGICFPIGFQANGIHAGIRKNKTKKDLSLIYSEVEAIASSCYTQNKVKGAPIVVTKQHLENGKAQAIITNSGNANTCNANGIDLANQTCALLAHELGIEEDAIIVASTGVIGQEMSIDPFETHMKELCDNLSSEHGLAACEAIMTTDSLPKQIQKEFLVDGISCRLGAIAKGSGMIHPNMATMLCFITSDVSIARELLDQSLLEVVQDTFNMVSVDGDTSTNDMVSILCNGLAKNTIISHQGDAYDAWKQALYDVCEDLAKAIARDGEGASKLLTCEVTGAKTTKDARALAKSVICSSLVKTAMFGNDANWGRILCALGYANADFHADNVKVVLSSNAGTINVCIASKGVSFEEEKALSILKEPEIYIHVHLEDGPFKAIAWGCDLTYDYVKINGEYRS